MYTYEQCFSLKSKPFHMFDSLLLKLVILSSFRLFYSHDENNIVNYNDAIARVDRVEELTSTSTKLYYDGNFSLILKVKYNEIYRRRTIFLKPFNGWVLSQNWYGGNFFIKIPGKEEPHEGERRGFYFASMSNTSFWAHRYDFRVSKTFNLDHHLL